MPARTLVSIVQLQQREVFTENMYTSNVGRLHLRVGATVQGLRGGLRHWSSATAQLGSTDAAAAGGDGEAAVASTGSGSLSDLPACQGLPVLGVLPQLLKTPLHKLLDAEQKQNWRDLFRVHLGFGNHAVVVSHPRWIEAVYRNEGQFPSRGSSLGLLAEATQEHAESGILAGIDGREWKRLRSALGRPVVPRKLQDQVPRLEQTAEVFLQVAMDSASADEHGYTRNAHQLLQRWAMEGVSRFLFPQDIPFQTLRDDMAEKLISGISRQNTYMGQTLFYPSWLLRYYTPRAYTLLKEAVKDVFEAGGHFVDDIHWTLSAKAERGEVVEPSSLLEHWILSKELSSGEVLTNTANMLAGGLDTTANTTAFLLHLMATNPKVQDAVHREVVQVAGTEGPITADVLNQLPLVKGCVKEALRLYPVAPVNVRQVESPMTLGGYHLPGQLTYMIPTWSIGRDEKHFKDPLQFQPERWVVDKSTISPFSLLAFGHGPRQCIGRRMAELEMWTLLAKVMQKCTLSVEDPTELGTEELILRPNRPINLKLERRA